MVQNSIGRVQWIDNCKGFAICLVIFGHTLLIDVSWLIIYSFHMPLFFFLSGLVCNEKKYNWKTFLKSRFNTIVIPYFFFYIVTWLYWLFLERGFRPIELKWWQPLAGMFYGAQWQGLMDHNIILWFLPCLFMTEVLFFLISRIKKRWLQFITIIALASCGFCIKINYPWGLNIALVALQFFWFGNILMGGGVNYLKSKNYATIGRCVSIIVIITYIFLSIVFNNKVNMGANIFGNVCIFELLSILGIGGVILFFLLFFDIKSGWMGWLGRNTLVIYAFHQPILRIIRFIGDKVLNGFPVDSNVIYALIADIIVIICLIPIVWLYNKYISGFLKKIYLKCA